MKLRISLGCALSLSIPGKKNGILLAFIPIYMDHWRTIWGSKIFDRSGKIESSSVEGFYARESCPVGSMYMVGEPR